MSVSPRKRVNWDDVERHLGHQLPSDYRHLVEAYGAGIVDRFLWILQPQSRNEHLDMRRQTRARLESLKQSRNEGEAIPYDIDSSHGHLIAWAVTDNGDCYFWRRTSLELPESWTIVVNEARGPRWEEFNGSATAFLVALLSGRFRSKVFPEDFPSAAPSFLAY